MVTPVTKSIDKVFGVGALVRIFEKNSSDIAEIDAPESSNAERLMSKIATWTSGRCGNCNSDSWVVGNNWLQGILFWLSSHAAITREALPRFPKHQIGV